MSDFVSTPAAPASPAGSKVAAGPFWPDIDCNHFRGAMRLGDSTVPHARIFEALQNAILTALNDLQKWQVDRQTAGYATLDAVPDQPEIGGEKRLTILWRRAVYAFAAADLIQTLPDITATKAGADRAEDTGPTAEDHEANGIHAVRDILGKPRVRVGLI